MKELSTSGSGLHPRGWELPQGLLQPRDLLDPASTQPAPCWAAHRAWRRRSGALLPHWKLGGAQAGAGEGWNSKIWVPGAALGGLWCSKGSPSYTQCLCIERDSARLPMAGFSLPFLPSTGCQHEGLLKPWVLGTIGLLCLSLLPSSTQFVSNELKEAAHDPHGGNVGGVQGKSTTGCGAARGRPRLVQGWGDCGSSAGSLSPQLQVEGLEISGQTQHGGWVGGSPAFKNRAAPRPAVSAVERTAVPMEKTTVLITGCSSGIGLGLAVRLAADDSRRFKGKGMMLWVRVPALWGTARLRSLHSVCHYA